MAVGSLSIHRISALIEHRLHPGILAAYCTIRANVVVMMLTNDLTAVMSVEELLFIFSVVVSPPIPVSLNSSQRSQFSLVLQQYSLNPVSRDGNMGYSE